MDIQLPEVSGLEVTKWIKEDDDLEIRFPSDRLSPPFPQARLGRQAMKDGGAQA